MSDHTTPSGSGRAAIQSRWPGLLYLIAGYLFGLTFVITTKTASGSSQDVLLKAAPFLALCVVLFLVGARKWMRAGEPRRLPGGAVLAIVVLAGLIPIGIGALLPSRWRPQLDVRNAGTKAVTFSYNEQSYETAPGEVWHTRFSAGDTITVRASGAGEAPAHTIPLPKDDPKPWTLNSIAQRYTADVNADDPGHIRLENLSYEEIASPPAAPQPWPK